MLVGPDGPVPDGLFCYLLSGGSHDWTFRFDGTRWSGNACGGNDRILTAEARMDRLALALAGRVPLEAAVDSSSDREEISKLKRYLPGP